MRSTFGFQFCGEVAGELARFNQFNKPGLRASFLSSNISIDEGSDALEVYVNGGDLGVYISSEPTKGWSGNNRAEYSSCGQKPEMAIGRTELRTPTRKDIMHVVLSQSSAARSRWRYC